MAKESKEGGNCERFVAIGYDFEIDCMPVEPEREEGGNGINRYHEQDADDTVHGSALQTRNPV